jgi:flavin reductase (DIM6/NTAB) family NADH-FMN oxidoreductase RutF
MDFPWGSDYHKKFITNVGLITSNGPHGKNIMAAEWTYLVSYSPAHILISLGHGKATTENILKTKIFGVSIAAEDQNWVSSVAGGSTGRDTSKVAALEELGVTFSTGKKLEVLLVEGSALQAECKVIDIIDKGGDHTLVLGEVVSGSFSEKKPLAYHENKYWKMNTQIEKPNDARREKIKNIVATHAKKKN